MQTSFSLGDWQSYTPTWSSSGTAPSLGNGSIGGWYISQGDILIVQTHICFGSTTTFGTGEYSYSLPPGVLAPSGSASWQVGRSVAIDSGTSLRFGVSAVQGVVIQSVTNGGGSFWGQTVPITWAVNDEITTFAMFRVFE